MTKIELEFDEDILEQARMQADEQHTTVAELFTNFLKQQTPPAKSHSTLGLFADEPELMDRVMELVREERNKPSIEKSVDIG